MDLMATPTARVLNKPLLSNSLLTESESGRRSNASVSITIKYQNLKEFHVLVSYSSPVQGFSYVTPSCCINSVSPTESCTMDYRNNTRNALDNHTVRWDMNN